jgi:lysophospholipase L1-like esterase
MQDLNRVSNVWPSVLLTLASAVALLLAATSAAMAQAAHSPSPAAAQPVTAICPPSDAYDDDAFVFFMDKLETPGQRISLASFPPAAMAKLTALQKAEADRKAVDWAYLCRYSKKNAELLRGGKRPQVVFMGDSITDFWQYADPGFFSSTFVDRGISGQTTPQMLLRFNADVVALNPRVVHILAGVNDLAGNTGPETDEMILNNVRAMIELAKVHHIKVVLASLLPAKVAPRPYGPPPEGRLLTLNGKLRQLAAQQHVTFLDYHSKLLGAGETMPAALTNDGLHPNRAGYAVMRPLAERAITAALH